MIITAKAELKHANIMAYLIQLEKITAFKIAPTASDPTAATESNCGKLGSSIPEATSPAARTVISGMTNSGLSKDKFPSFAGALSNCIPGHLCGLSGTLVLQGRS